MTGGGLGVTLAEATRRLRAAGIGSARLDARVLAGHALGLAPATVATRPERPLSADEAALIERLVARRERREPIAHITGRREFWSLSFQVTADTLDPRPDSEAAVEAMLAALPDRRAPWRLLDFGTGTGCLLLALLSELPAATGLGVDRSPAALAVAAGNAERLGLAGRASFRLGDWGRGLDGLFDAIIANPPYIPDDEIAGLEAEVARWEPRGALAGGGDGLDCYRALAPDMARLLTPGGVAVVEVGDGQAEAVSGLLEAAGLAGRGVWADLAGRARCVVCGAPAEKCAAPEKKCLE